MNASEFGQYALALSISMAAHTLAFTWAEAAAFRFFATARAEQRLPDHFAILLLIAATLGTAALALTATALAVAGLREDAAGLAAFAAGAAVLRLFVRIARESDRAACAFGRYAVLETLYLGLGFAAGVACLLCFDLGAAAPFAGLAFAGLVVALLDAPLLLARARGGAPSAARAHLYLGYGAPLALALAVDIGVQTLARIILASTSGTAELGAYAAAFGLTRGLDVVFMGLGAAFAPAIFAAYEEQGADAARATARGAFTLLAAIAIPACVGLIFVAEPLANLMVGEALRAQTAAALPWLACAALFWGFAFYYLSEAFQLTRRTGVRALVMLAPGALQLALTSWLAPHLGAVGGAIAAMAGAGAGALALGCVGRRYLKLPLPLMALARIAVATVVMGLALAALPQAQNAAALIVAILTGAGVYSLCAVALDIGGVRAPLVSVFHRLRAGAPRDPLHAS